MFITGDIAGSATRNLDKKKGMNFLAMHFLAFVHIYSRAIYNYSRVAIPDHVQIVALVLLFKYSENKYFAEYSATRFNLRTDYREIMIPNYLHLASP